MKPLSAKALARLREILDPTKIGQEDIRAGSEFLHGMDDLVLTALFYDVTVKKVPPETLAKAWVEANAGTVSQQDLQSALRRLSAVGVVLAQDLFPPKKKKSETAIRPVIPLTLSPGTTLQEHIYDAFQADKAVDGTTKMAGLVTLLEKQLYNLYGQASREPQPFFMLAQINQSATTLMNALSHLHRMQLDTGILKREPERIELGVNAAGAFQTYLGSMDAEAKAQMASFVEGFAKLIKERKG